MPPKLAAAPTLDCGEAAHPPPPFPLSPLPPDGVLLPLFAKMEPPPVLPVGDRPPLVAPTVLSPWQLG